MDLHPNSLNKDPTLPWASLYPDHSLKPGPINQTNPSLNELSPKRIQQSDKSESPDIPPPANSGALTDEKLSN
jgi:hypothetical protein